MSTHLKTSFLYYPSHVASLMITQSVLPMLKAILENHDHHSYHHHHLPLSCCQIKARLLQNALKKCSRNSAMSVSLIMLSGCFHGTVEVERFCSNLAIKCSAINDLNLMY